MSNIVPSYVSLSEVYDDTDQADLRYESIKNNFVYLFNQLPFLYARAPGRVNLIGEHIDYSGYSVLPMAIDKDTVIAVAYGEVNNKNNENNNNNNTSIKRPFLVVANTNPIYSTKYFYSREELFNISKGNENNFHWTSYVQCGLRGLIEYIYPEYVTPNASSLNSSNGPYRPLILLVDGAVPPSAGLSSSSSLVCASILAMAQAYHWIDTFALTKKTLANIATSAERYIGTMGGGMDQAISFLSTKFSAQRIDFFPLDNRPLQLPQGAKFVIANSLYESSKAVSANTYFNKRVLECKLAALWIEKKLNLPCDEKINFSHEITLKSVQLRSKLEISQLLSKLLSIFDDSVAPLSLDQITSTIGQDPYTLFEGHRLHSVMKSIDRNEKSFNLFRRAQHVFSEASRVFQFEIVCNSKDSDANKLTQLGRLMNESHRSCDLDYDCSCEDLNKLVKISNESGALGSRLTGAGWGGCVVSLVHSQDYLQFIQNVTEKYFIAYKGLKSSDPHLKDGSFIFTSIPSTGAGWLMGPGNSLFNQKQFKSSQLKVHQKKKSLIDQASSVLSDLATSVVSSTARIPEEATQPTGTSGSRLKLISFAVGVGMAAVIIASAAQFLNRKKQI